VKYLLTDVRNLAGYRSNEIFSNSCKVSVVSAIISAILCKFGYNLQCRKMLSLDKIRILFEMYVLCNDFVTVALEDWVTFRLSKWLLKWYLWCDWNSYNLKQTRETSGNTNPKRNFIITCFFLLVNGKTFQTSCEAKSDVIHALSLIPRTHVTLPRYCVTLLLWSLSAHENEKAVILIVNRVVWC
jgi:hypothetical protein